MCVTDFDLDRVIAAAEDEQAPRPGRQLIGGRHAGVAWGLAEGRDDQDPADAAKAADPSR
jgi:hypothetical protein